MCPGELSPWQSLLRRTSCPDQPKSRVTDIEMSKFIIVGEATSFDGGCASIWNNKRYFSCVVIILFREKESTSSFSKQMEYNIAANMFTVGRNLCCKYVNVGFADNDFDWYIRIVCLECFNHRIYSFCDFRVSRICSMNDIVDLFMSMLKLIDIARLRCFCFKNLYFIDSLLPSRFYWLVWSCMLFAVFHTQSSRLNSCWFSLSQRKM